MAGNLGILCHICVQHSWRNTQYGWLMMIRTVLHVWPTERRTECRTKSVKDILLIYKRSKQIRKRQQHYSRGNKCAFIGAWKCNFKGIITYRPGRPSNQQTQTGGKFANFNFCVMPNLCKSKSIHHIAPGTSAQQGTWFVWSLACESYIFVWALIQVSGEGGGSSKAWLDVAIVKVNVI